jgi:cyclopropane-fatty-acyl-phospholipid synthase
MSTTLQAAQPQEEPTRGLLALAERGLLPDPLLRLGIRRLCQQRLREEQAGGVQAQAQRLAQRLHALEQSALALHVDAANRQHYEVPAAFFQLCLGKRLKYSGCYYPQGNETLDQAEEAMLGLYAQRAQLADGQQILELGCGWGSLTLWMAERYPQARITAVSNSVGQRDYIQAQCRLRGLANVRVITTDVNELQLQQGAYDRCVSVEMFEHLRNYRQLLQRISHWLRPDGKLFVHIFVHRQFLYPFQTQGQDNWMGRHFFTGGQMPSADTLLFFQQHLALRQRWLIDGRHYQRTANHWLQNQDRHAPEVSAILQRCHGDAAPLWQQRWRMFWMACAELFGLHGGQEWMVAHYLFEQRKGEA